MTRASGNADSVAENRPTDTFKKILTRFANKCLIRYADRYCTRMLLTLSWNRNGKVIRFVVECCAVVLRFVGVCLRSLTFLQSKYPKTSRASVCGNGESPCER